MQIRSVGCWLAIAWLVAGFGTTTASAPQPQDAEHTLLELGTDAAAPGGEAIVTLSLRIPDGVTVGKVVSDVSFPTSVLEFDRARRGLSAQAAEAEVTAVAGDPKDGTTTVRVTVSVKDGRQLFPGSIADLTFKVRDDVSKDKVAKEAMKVTLKQVASAWSEGNPPTQIASVISRDGEIEVSMDAPVAACFFYMH